MTKKYLFALATAGGLLALTFAFSWLGVVFGWTNPTQAPPSGSGLITVLNGNLGINTSNPTSQLTVNGPIDALNNLVRGVATPIAGTDAANKDYVLAASSNALTGPLIVFGQASKPGLLPTQPGQNVPACPSGYQDILYSPDMSSGTPGTLMAGGYGPLGIAEGSGYYAGADPFSNEQTFNETSVWAIGTYSICSTVISQIIPSRLPEPGTGTQGTFASGALACNTRSDGVGGFTTTCNTCRICGKVPSP